MNWSPEKIAQVELHCTDLDEARRFYCGTLGLEFVGIIGESLFIRCGETNLIVQRVPRPKPGSIVYFSADGRIEEATRSLKERGVAFTEEPRRIAAGFDDPVSGDAIDVWLGFFKDPWGNPLALLANMPAAG